MSAVRVPGAGSAIDRARPVAFRFDGRRLSGFAGDTLASALLANGIDVVGRSFKLHRPRGLMADGAEEPNGFVELLAPDAQPAALATLVPLVPGLEARSLHGWPRAGLDGLAWLQGFRRVLPAGFYYKTFMGRSGHLWPAVEPLIRRLAGLGRLPEAPPSRPSEHRHDHVDVLVVGGGHAGRAAAEAAAAAAPDLSVLLVEDGAPAATGAADAGCGPARGVRLLTQACVVALQPGNLAIVHERRPAEPFLADRMWKIRAGCIVLATGAVEQPLVLAGNDRPGAMLAGAARGLLERFGVRVGERVVLIANGAAGLPAAAAVRGAGGRVELVSPAGSTWTSPEGQRVIRAAALSIRGRGRVREVRLRTADGEDVVLPCDAVLMSGGLQPALQLWTQAGGRLRWSATSQALLPDGEVPGVLVCGAAAGAHGDAASVQSGRAAGHAAAAAAANGTAAVGIFGGPGFACDGGIAIPPLHDGEAAFVDIHNDVTADDVALALREGYRSIEHVKRYTTLGMGPDQGRTAARNGAVLAAAADAPTRVTTMRPPVRPVPLAAVAGGVSGPWATPWRETPVTGWAVGTGAVLYESGADWRRPGYWPRPGETMADAVRREVLAVRQGAGLYDSSPLGKILVRGRDSARFLDLAYAGRLSTLKPMAARYAVMLREDGRILDDGVAIRETECRFVLTTTAGQLAAVLAWLEFLLAAHWPELDVRCLDVTEAFADIVVCGPQARAVLGRMGTDIDLDPAAFPAMAVRDGHVAGIPARVMRVSFTGEASYEIWTRRRHAAALWQAALDAGAPHGLTPVGSEANHVLRVEKGFISMAHEVDGLVNPYDLGLGRCVDMGKRDFIGRRALQRDLDRDRATPRRRAELVGLLTQDDGPPLAEGMPTEADEDLSTGFVTASVASPTLGRPVALALVRGGRDAIGSSITVADGGAPRTCAVVAPVFYDPAGTRMRA